jgi:hypothetical protein
MLRKVVTFLDDFSSWSAGLANVEVYDFGKEQLNLLYDDYAVITAPQTDILIS